MKNSIITKRLKLEFSECTGGRFFNEGVCPLEEGDLEIVQKLNKQYGTGKTSPLYISGQNVEGFMYEFVYLKELKDDGEWHRPTAVLQEEFTFLDLLHLKAVGHSVVDQFGSGYSEQELYDMQVAKPEGTVMVNIRTTKKRDYNRYVMFINKK